MKKLRNTRRTDAAFYRATRVEAWGQQDRRCRYCISVLRRAEVTADHVHPKSRGGTDDSKNILAACGRCNRAKGSMAAEAFLRLIKRPPDDAPFRIHLISSVRRINLAADRSCRRILRFAGIEPEVQAQTRPSPGNPSEWHAEAAEAREGA